VRAGGFREDLFYRLNVLAVHVAPLADRREDVPALVAHFCRGQKRPLRFSEQALAMLANAAWPGHVRQLRNLVDRVAAFADDVRRRRYPEDEHGYTMAPDEAERLKLLLEHEAQVREPFSGDW